MNIAIKDYGYNEQLENLLTNEVQPDKKSDWLGKNSFTQNVELQGGFSIFVPFSFDYRLPK